MNDLQTRIREALNRSASVLPKKASEAEIIANAEKTPEPEKVDLVKDSINGPASDVIATQTAKDGEPGSTTDVADKPKDIAGPGYTSDPEANKDGEAAKVLSVKYDEVEKDIKLLDKAASVIKEAAAKIADLKVEDLVAEFSADLQKKASAVNPEELLLKCASAGNPAAQYAVDYLASFNLGMAKKAAAMEEAIAATNAATPEEVAALEDAMNEAAVSNPELILAEEGAAPEVEEEVKEEVEDKDGEEEVKEEVEEEVKDSEEPSITEDQVQEALAQYGAEVESAVQEAVLETAIAIQEADPSISDEEALQAAQEQVADAIETIDAQQAMGMVGEDGAYAVSDEDAATAVDAMLKSASDFPLRDKLVGSLNQRLGISPAAFAQRLAR